MTVTKIPYQEFVDNYAPKILSEAITPTEFFNFWVDSLGDVVDRVVVTYGDDTGLISFPPLANVHQQNLKNVLLQVLITQNLMLYNSLGIFTDIEGTVMPVSVNKGGFIVCAVHLYMTTTYGETMEVGYHCGLTQEGVTISNEVLSNKRVYN